MIDLQPDIGPKQRYPRPDANFVDLDHADCHEAQLKAVNIAKLPSMLSSALFTKRRLTALVGHL